VYVYVCVCWGVCTVCVCVFVKYHMEYSLLYVQQTVKHFTLRIFYDILLLRKRKKNSFEKKQKRSHVNNIFSGPQVYCICVCVSRRAKEIGCPIGRELHILWYDLRSSLAPPIQALKRQTILPKLKKW